MKRKTGRSGEGSDLDFLERPAIEELHLLFDRHERHQMELAKANEDRTGEAIEEERGRRKKPTKLTLGREGVPAILTSGKGVFDGGM